MNAPTLTIGQQTATLVQPSVLGALALHRTRDQLGDDSALWLALCAAAIFMCWPKDARWPARKRPGAWRPGVRIEQYGYEIFEDLAAVETLPVLIEAGAQAYRWAQTCRLTATEVQEAEVFSEAPREGP